MKKPKGWNRHVSVFWFLPFALLFLVQVFPRLTADSPAGDEVVDISDGYFYWNGDVISDSRHPPLAKALQALPLRMMNLKSHSGAPFTNYERRDFNFLFVLNREKFETILLAGRSVSLLFGLGLGFLLFLAARNGPASVLFFTLFFWALEPNFLAFSGLVLADIPLTFFFFLAVFSFQKSLEKPDWKSSMGTGALAGMAMTAKFSGVILIPVFLFFEILQWIKAGSKHRKWISFRALHRWFFGFAGALSFISIIYFPGTLKMPEHGWPMSYFLDGFRAMSSFSGHPTFFLGELTKQNHFFYFPLAFLLKSALPFLLCLILAVLLGVLKKTRISPWLWLPGLMFFSAMVPFHNIGIREILPVFPFCVLMAGRGAGWLWEGTSGEIKRVSRAAVGFLVLFQAVSLGLNFPRHISYFNELIPGDRKIFWLGDSNLDIGQDTKRLAEAGRQQGWERVKLAYFGITDPKLYGLDWETWRQKDLTDPQPGWVYAVNLSFLQLGPAFLPGAQKITRSWITQRTPTGKVGDTWYFFKIPEGFNEKDDSPELPSTLPFKIYEHLNE